MAISRARADGFNPTEDQALDLLRRELRFHRATLDAPEQVQAKPVGGSTSPITRENSERVSTPPMTKPKRECKPTKTIQRKTNPSFARKRSLEETALRLKGQTVKRLNDGGSKRKD